jgi:hypothetical protein
VTNTQVMQFEFRWRYGALVLCGYVSKKLPGTLHLQVTYPHRYLKAASHHTLPYEICRESVAR